MILNKNIRQLLMQQLNDSLFMELATNNCGNHVLSTLIETMMVNDQENLKVLGKINKEGKKLYSLSCSLQNNAQQSYFLQFVDGIEKNLKSRN